MNDFRDVLRLGFYNMLNELMVQPFFRHVPTVPRWAHLEAEYDYRECVVVIALLVSADGGISNLRLSTMKVGVDRLRDAGTQAGPLVRNKVRSLMHMVLDSLNEIDNCPCDDWGDGGMV